MGTEKNLQGATLGEPPINKVLVIAPHRDDEILGCGGTIAKYAAQGIKVYVCVVTEGKGPLFEKEASNAIQEECMRAGHFVGVEKTFFLKFPAAMLESIPRHQLNDAISRVIKEVEPGEVYIPHRGDLQVDHKITADACMVGLRPKDGCPVKKIYAYETLSETGWDIPDRANEFIPMVYNDITDYLDKKIQAMEFYKSQLSDFPGARSIGAVKALASYRGSMMNMQAAEAFCLIRELKG